MKSKIKNDLIVGENWFDKEINKMINLTENSSYSTDLESIIDKIKENKKIPFAAFCGYKMETHYNTVDLLLE
jgi:hypothetical protein